jgi:hypothetical protein
VPGLEARVKNWRRKEMVGGCVVFFVGLVDGFCVRYDGGDI